MGIHSLSFDNTAYLAGLAVTAHNNNALCTATFTHLSIDATTAWLPDAWADQDIGSPGHLGSASYDGTTWTLTWTINGSGADIWNAADQFHYADTQVSGDQTIIARITGVENTDTYAKAGVMFRDSTAAGSKFIALLQMPNNQVTMRWRDSADANASSTGTILGSTDSVKWVKLVRQADTYYGYYASTTATPTAGDWELMGIHTLTFDNSTYLAGLAVTAHNNSTLCTSTFTDVTIQQTTPWLAPGWSDLDIASPGRLGSASYDGSTWTLQGGGSNIWDTADQFHYTNTPASGDQTLIAHVATVENTDTYAQAGIMFRDSTAAGSKFIALLQLPNHQLTMRWRDSANTNAALAGTEQGTTTSPKWLKLVKHDNSYRGYYADTTATPTPADWQLIANHSLSFDNATYLAGLAVTAHNNTDLCTATFTDVGLYAPATATITPDPSNDYTQGSPQSFTSTVTDPGINDTFTYAWTVTQGGNPYSLPAEITTAPEFTFTPDTPGNYIISLTVTDSDDASATVDYAATISPSAPADFTTTPASTSQIDLSWSSVPDATGYLITRSEDGETFTQLADLGPSTLTYSDTSLPEGAIYIYLIQTDGPGTTLSATSAAYGTTLIAAPSALTVTPISATEVQLFWTNNSASSPRVAIERAITGTDDWQFLDEVEPDITTYTDTSAHGSTDYEYRIYADNSWTYSQYDQTDSIHTPLGIADVPEDVTATRVNSTEYELTWSDKDSQATTFKVYRWVWATGTWDLVDTINAEDATDGQGSFTATIDLPEDEAGCFLLSAADDVGESDTGDALGDTAPRLHAQAITDTTFSLFWSNPIDRNVELEQAGPGDENFSFGQELGVGCGTIDFSGNYAAYAFRLRWDDIENDQLDYTQSIGQHVPTPAAPEVTMPTFDYTPTPFSPLVQPVLRWYDRSVGESGFEIYAAVNSGDYQYLDTVGPNTTSYPLPEYLQGASISLRVRAFENGESGGTTYSGFSTFTASWRATCSPDLNVAPPAISNIHVSANTYWLTHDEAPDDLHLLIRSEYTDREGNTVERYDDYREGPWSLDDLAPGAQVTFAACWYDPCSPHCTSWSSEYTCTSDNPPPDWPVAVPVAGTVTATSALLTWQSTPPDDNDPWTPTPVSIEFEVAEAHGATSPRYAQCLIGTLPSDCASGTFLAASLQPETEYSIRARIHFAGIPSSAVTAWSDPVAVTTQPTPPVAPTNLTAKPFVKRNGNTGVRLTWRNTAGNETGYYIYRSPDGGNTWVRIDDVPSNTGRYTDTRATVDVHYQYEVAAHRGDALSSFSNIVPATINKVTVYIWESHGLAFGHVAIMFADNVYASWWPDQPLSVSARARKPDDLVWDNGHEPGVTAQTFVIAGLNDNAMETEWVHFNDTHTLWQLFGWNCTTLTRHLLEAGGAQFRNRILWSPFIHQPTDIYRQLRWLSEGSLER